MKIKIAKIPEEVKPELESLEIAFDVELDEVQLLTLGYPVSFHYRGSGKRVVSLKGYPSAPLTLIGEKLRVIKAIENSVLNFEVCNCNSINDCNCWSVKCGQCNNGISPERGEIHSVNYDFAKFEKPKRVQISKSKRFKILKRDNFSCFYCGADTGVILEVDHKIAIANGGTNEDSNLVTACFDCNRGKRDSNA